MSLAIREGVPARTCKSSTTRARRASYLSARDKKRRVSPTTAKGIRSSACKACWEADGTDKRRLDHVSLCTSVDSELYLVFPVEGFEVTGLFSAETR